MWDRVAGDLAGNRARGKEATMAIRTIVIDDEKLAIEGLRLRLAAHADVAIVDVARNAREAIRKIKRYQPDLIFLDIQLPGFDGFAILQTLDDTDPPPLVVIVTAYSHYAIRAYEADAEDYLVKPIDPERLALTLARVRQRMQERRGGVEAVRLRALLADVAPEAAAQQGNLPSLNRHANRYETILNIKDRGQIFRIAVADIERIAAGGDYMVIHTSETSFILRETMKDLEQRLDPRNFKRVHRSAIVNLSQVRQVRPHSNGESFLILASGAQVKVSRSYRDVVAHFVH